MTTQDFPRAIPVERGCGERDPGGVYVECGLSPFGWPLEHFLVDPPQPVPEGLDIINKPQIWEDPDTHICHLVIWVGAESYPFCPDYIEETKRYGASRRINPNLELTRLSSESTMILAHPRARNTHWDRQLPPQECKKHVQGHNEESSLVVTPASGPCLFKIWELIPRAEAKEVLPPDGDRFTCLREIGSTLYTYHPTEESDEGLEPGLFAILPITGFALIQHEDGTVNERAKRKLQEGNLPYYESDK